MVSKSIPGTMSSQTPQQSKVQQSLSTSIANTKSILSIFEKYQKERLHFVQTVAEHASRETNVDVLQQAGAMGLLKPLLGDPVPAVQQAAAVALGRLANYNPELAAAVVNSDILPQLIFSLREQNRFYKKSASFVLRSIARHSPQLAQSVVDSGALQSLVQCLEEFDPSVKESSAWALGYIARHNGELAQAVVDAGAIPLLVLCVQEPELALKRIAISALSDICKHSPELAQSVVDGQTIPIIVPYILPSYSLNSGTGTAVQGGVGGMNFASGMASGDARLQRQVIMCLAQMAKHTPSLAESVVDGDIFPHVFWFLTDPRRSGGAGNGNNSTGSNTRGNTNATNAVSKTDEAGTHFSSSSNTANYSDSLKYATATLICEMTKHTPELAQLVVNGGGIASLVAYLQASYLPAHSLNGTNTSANPSQHAPAVISSGAGASYRLPAVMALGYLAAFSETLAMAVIVSKSVPILVDTLTHSIQTVYSQKLASTSNSDKLANLSLGGNSNGDSVIRVGEMVLLAATCWTMGQIGRHSQEHARVLTDQGVLLKLLTVLVTDSSIPGGNTSGNQLNNGNPSTPPLPADGQNSGENAADLKVKAKRALKSILLNTMDLQALEPLLRIETPANILKYIVGQIAKILPNDAAGRSRHRNFVTSGSLSKIQELSHYYSTIVSANKEEGMSYQGSKMAESIRLINECYPEEIVRYYSPGYSNTLLMKMDNYVKE